MQTGEMGFSLEMNRLRDNDPDDRLLHLTSRVVSGRPCCVYRQQTHNLKKNLFFKVAAVKLCARSENATGNFPNNPRESACGVTTLLEDLSLSGNNEKTLEHPFQH